VTARRALLVLAGAVVAVLVLAVLGRHERADANSHEENGIRSIAARVHARKPSAYRLTAFADCLLYPEQGDPYALELCFDRQGRAIEAIDRHERSQTRISSVRYDPSLSPVRRDPRSLFDELKAARAFPPTARFTGTLPLSHDVRASGTAGDTGPVPVGTPPFRSN
jgi:hypothetical protein